MGVKMNKILIISFLAIFFSIPANAAYCPKTEEVKSGNNKICYYNCLGSIKAKNVKSFELCPLSING
tara:strand:+ start:457 stop:657 length:201 start_codon:yes stop_codon:yes gene_type:complete